MFGDLFSLAEGLPALRADENRLRENNLLKPTQTMLKQHALGNMQANTCRYMQLFIARGKGKVTNDTICKRQVNNILMTRVADN